MGKSKVRVQAERARQMYEAHVGRHLPKEERTDWFLLPPTVRDTWMQRAKNPKAATHD